MYPSLFLVLHISQELSRPDTGETSEFANEVWLIVEIIDPRQVVDIRIAVEVGKNLLHSSYPQVEGRRHTSDPGEQSSYVADAER